MKVILLDTLQYGTLFHVYIVYNHIPAINGRKIRENISRKSKKKSSKSEKKRVSGKLLERSLPSPREH